MADKDSSPAWNLKLGIGILCVGIVLIVGIVLLVFHPGYETTNDAQIDGHIHPINARISGTVIWVNPDVEDTHFVKAGTVLARLDRNDFSPAVDRLRGEVNSSEAQRRAAQLNLPIATASATTRLASAQAAVRDGEAELSSARTQQEAADASVRQLQALYLRAEHDRVRYEALVGTHDISRSEYELRATDARSLQEQLGVARANLASATLRIASAEQKLDERRNDLTNAETAPQLISTARTNVDHAEAELTRSKASLQTAELDLSYTEIVAPVDGIVGRRSIEVGQRVANGQLLLTIVPPHDIWTIANFRETQLRRMSVGEAVRIHVDSYDTDLDGKVESLGGATGSKYSVIAPDNATGNFVKVVQRVPVRIRLEQYESSGRPLLPGMSVEVRVTTKAP